MLNQEILNQIEKLQKTNPYCDIDELEAEIENVKNLPQEEKEIYLKELTRLAIEYKWDDHKCPMDGTYF